MNRLHVTSARLACYKCGVVKTKPIIYSLINLVIAAWVFRFSAREGG